MKVTIDTFFPSRYNGVMSETLCEPTEACNNNEILFKGMTAMWMAFVSVLVPSTSDTILPKLQSSAQAAAKSCTGNGNNTCGVRWYTGSWDGWSGLEEQLIATAVFASTLITEKDTPVTSTTGGNSSSDPSSGTGDQDDHGPRAITTADQAGAGIVTVVFTLSWVGLLAWLVI